MYWHACPSSSGGGQKIGELFLFPYLQGKAAGSRGDIDGGPNRQADSQND